VTIRAIRGLIDHFMSIQSSQVLNRIGHCGMQLIGGRTYRTRKRYLTPFLFWYEVGRSISGSGLDCPLELVMPRDGTSRIHDANWLPKRMLPGNNQPFMLSLGVKSSSGCSEAANKASN
jgi:hypothetical protein